MFLLGCDANEGIKYHCDECDYQATTEDNLKKHKQSKHMGVKYHCMQSLWETVYNEE